MTRWIVHTVDESRLAAYPRRVDAAGHPHKREAQASTDLARRRRRPPSPTEQANRTNRILPWADVWKELKASGRWR